MRRRTNVSNSINYNRNMELRGHTDLGGDGANVPRLRLLHRKPSTPKTNLTPVRTNPIKRPETHRSHERQLCKLGSVGGRIWFDTGTPINSTTSHLQTHTRTRTCHARAPYDIEVYIRAPR